MLGQQRRIIQAALTMECETCKAKPGKPCGRAFRGHLKCRSTKTAPICPRRLKAGWVVLTAPPREAMSSHMDQ